DHVLVEVLVDEIDDRRETRRLAASRLPRNEDQAPAGGRELRQDLTRQVQLLEGGNIALDVPEHVPQMAPLAKNVDSEAANPGELIGNVNVAFRVEAVLLGVFDDLVNLQSVLGRDLIGIEKVNRAINTKGRRAPDFDKKVGCLLDHHLPEHLMKFHR